MKGKFVGKSTWWRPFLMVSAVLFVAGFCLNPHEARADECSSYIGDMTINEVYELGNKEWVEVRLLDTSLSSSVYDQWRVAVCAEGQRWCATYDLSNKTVLYPDDYPDWFSLNVNKSYVDLRKNGGMEILLLDQYNKVIDYLSVNNYDPRRPDCANFLYPTDTGSLSSDLKGIYRDPDGTGPWKELGSSGATGEPTQGFDNNGFQQLVAHYALEGDVSDESSNGHDGGSQGTVGYQSARICDGMQLDGSGYLVVPDHSDFDITDSLTVTAWIYPDSLSVSGHESLYSILSKDTNYEFHVQSNGSLYWWWGGGSFSTGAGVIPVDTWSHVAFVYSKSAGSMKIYVNGTQVASHAYSADLPVNANSLLIGSDISTGGGEIAGRRFYGAIDEVRIYHSAMAAVQVANLVAETDPCGLPTPLAEWRFDECDYDGVGALAEDAGGTYDATAQGEILSEPDGVVGRAAMLDHSGDAFLTNTNVPMWSDWTVSTWFRLPFSVGEGSRYHVLGAMTGGGNDLLWVDSRSNYRWGAWANYRSAYGSFSFASLADGWHHLVAVAHNGRTDLYIDGTWRDSVSLQPYGNLHYLGTSYEAAGGEEGFRADLDEFLVFSGVLSGTQISSLYGLQAADRNVDGTVRSDILCGPAIDHFEIVHDGSALTCAPESVTVRACVNADCSTLYTDPVTISLSPSGWLGTTPKTLSSGSGTFRLRHTTPEAVTLSVSGNPAADHATQCVDGSGGDSCSLVFHESGFLFNVPDLRSCTDGEDIIFSAVRADATAEHCIGDDSFASTTRNVNFWSTYQEPATGTLAVVVNDTAVSGADPGSPIALTFDTGANTTLKVRYADAGRMQLSARFTGSGDETGLVMEGVDSFVVAPHHLRVRATTDGTTLLNNTATTGTPRWPAGVDFEVEVAGVCADDTVTPNFAATTTLTATSANPAAGTFTGGPFAAGDYSGGIVSDTSAYSEVGTVTLQAEAANYLGSGIDVTGTATVGRFTPHHFTAVTNSPSFVTACSAGGITYIGQDFDYAVAPVITVTAKNKQGTTTANYTGAWWKITGTILTGKTYSAAEGTLDLLGLPATDPVISDLGGGMGVLSFASGTGLKFVRGTPVAPFDAEIGLAINVFDADGIAAESNPVRFGSATAGNGIAFDNGKAMRWGRLAMKNAYGSELLALSMPVRTEYFNGTAFVQNLQDGCTTLDLSQWTLFNGTTTFSGEQTVPVGSGSSTATIYTPVVAGDAGLTFSASGSNGFIQVSAGLSLLPWLRYDWDGDGSHDDDPTARASFGIYKGRPGMIYMRESFR